MKPLIIYWSLDRGMTIWPIIFLPRSRKGNNPELVHELTHFKSQAWITPLWIIWYLLNKEFRFKMEVRAFQEQLNVTTEYREDARMYMATCLEKQYHNLCTYQKALESLKL